MKLVGRSVLMHELMETSGVCFGTSGARGLVSELSADLCFAFTTAFLKTVSGESECVVLAIDLRPSSPRIAEACAAAIQYSGRGVVFCGPIPTPALAYYAQRRGVPAIMITGSHIPFDRNGIKFYSVAGEISKDDEARMSRAVVDIPIKDLTVSLPPVDVSAGQFYIERYLEFFEPGSLEGMKIGFFEHSSAARDILRELLERLGADVLSLGRTQEFVPIDTEAVSDADIRRARQWAERHTFDAILSTDGDADRPLIGDEFGHWFRGDVAGILCAQFLGAQSVVTTMSCNTAAERCLAFKNVVRTRIGSPYVIEGIAKLINDGAQRVVGFEPNGGFLLGSPFKKNGRTLEPLLTRDAVLPILCLLATARLRRCKVSELSQNLPARYTASDRLQDFPPEASRKVLKGLAESMAFVDELLNGLCGKPTGFDQTDGLRVIFDNDEIVHFRPSGNAPELRCYVETGKQARSEFLVRACLSRIKKLA